MAKPLVASHTFLDTFARCPKQAYHRYVAKDLPFVETDAMRWGNRVHEALERRLRDGAALPEGLEAYEPFAATVAAQRSPQKAVLCEEKLGMKADGSWCGFFDPGVWLRGKLDVLIAGESQAFILDWKTGKRREDPAELETFAVLVRANHRGIEKITGAYVWLKDGRMGDVHELTDTTRKEAAIRQTMAQVGELQKRGEPWPAHENGLCKQYCDVVSCQFNGRGK